MKRILEDNTEETEERRGEERRGECVSTQQAVQAVSLPHSVTTGPAHSQHTPRYHIAISICHNTILLSSKLKPNFNISKHRGYFIYSKVKTKIYSQFSKSSTLNINLIVQSVIVLKLISPIFPTQSLI